MWRIYVVISAAFLLILIIKLINHHFKKSRVIKLKALGEYKKFFDLSIIKVQDNRGIIYYSNGPINIKYDPSNFDLYRTRLTEIPSYSYKENKDKKYGRTPFIIYWVLFVLSFIVFALSLVWILLLNFAPESVEFLNIKSLETLKEVFTSNYFCYGVGLFMILCLVFILCNRNYKKHFVYNIPVYLKMVNRAAYAEAMKPIYVKLG